MKDSTTNTFDTANSNAMLCDGFLIPMTDFVLEQLNEQNSRTKPMREVFNSLEKYAKFLKQPLKLEMFVPCDEDGNILKEPKRWEDYLQYPDSFDGNKEWDELYDYQQAKEKVLFVFKPHFDISVIKHHVLQGRNIEYLANFGSMQLTKTALNAIFG